MPVQKGAEVAPAKGKLGVLLVGLGAVSTTFIAGVEAIKKGIGRADRQPDADGYDSSGQAHGQPRALRSRTFVPLANLEDLVFGAWDIFPDSAYEAAMHAGVLEKDLVAQLKKPLQKIKPMKAVFDQIVRQTSQRNERKNRQATNFSWRTS